MEARPLAADAALARIEKLADEGWVNADTVERMRGLYDFRRRRFTARFSEDGETPSRSSRAPTSGFGARS